MAVFDFVTADNADDPHVKVISSDNPALTFATIPIYCGDTDAAERIAAAVVDALNGAEEPDVPGNAEALAVEQMTGTGRAVPTVQDVAPLKPVKRAKKRQSRIDRWQSAVTRAKTALGEIISSCDELEDAMSELQGVQEEYQEWKDNLPDNLQSGNLADKLDEVCNLDIADKADEIRTAADELDGTLDEAEGMDMPLGFGRD
jgi:hypothetical protein